MEIALTQRSTERILYILEKKELYYIFFIEI